MIVPRRAGLSILALACAVGTALVAEIALRTQRGAAVDVAIFGHVSTSDAPRIAAVGQRALDAISVASVAAALVLLIGISLVTRRRRAAVEAVAIVVCAIATTEVLKHAVAHLGLDDARSSWRGTFPSGHETLAASLGLSLVAAVPPRLKPLAALGGAVYAAGIGAALVLLRWHLPSDVAGGELVAGFWTCAVLLCSRSTWVRSPVSASTAGATAAVGLAGAAIAGYIGAHHPAIAAETLSSGALVAAFCLFAALAFAIFGGVVLLAGEARPG